MGDKVRDQNFITIHGWMINQLELAGTELMVYAIIYGFSQDGESKFTGSRGYLAEWCGTTLPTIDTALKKLIDRELIQKETETTNGIRIIKYSVNFTGYKKILHPYKKILHNNIDNNIDFSSVINNKERAEETEEEKPEESKEELINYFIEKMEDKGVNQRPLINRMQMLRECELDPRWKEIGPEEENRLREYILGKR